MKSILVVSLVFLVACASQDKKKSSDELSINNGDFKKEAPLKNSDVKDFYVGGPKSINPALQDETLDRLTSSEIKDFKAQGDPLIELALRCASKDYEEGLQLASKHFNRYQKIAQYWNLVGNCHLKKGNERKALLFYNKALELNSQYVPALNNIGVMYTRQGQFQKALVAFERANQKSKFAKTPRYNLAKLYLMYGLADSALPLFQSLLNQAPQDVGLLNAVASCLFLQGDYTRALGYYQQISKKQIERPEIGLNYAMTLNRLGHKKEALKVLDDIDSPESGELKNYYSVVKARLGE